MVRDLDPKRMPPLKVDLPEDLAPHDRFRALASKLLNIGSPMSDTVFDALTVDVQFHEDGKLAVLTVVGRSLKDTLTIKIPASAVEDLRDRISEKRPPIVRPSPAR